MGPVFFRREGVKGLLNPVADLSGGIAGLFLHGQKNSRLSVDAGVDVGRIVDRDHVRHLTDPDWVHIVEAHVHQDQIFNVLLGRKLIPDPD